MIGSVGYFVYTNDIEDKAVVGSQQNHTQTTTSAPEEHTQKTTTKTTTTTTKAPVVQWEQNEEIKILRDYLRIPTFHPNIIYSKFCFSFALNQKLNVGVNDFSYIFVAEECVYFLEDLAEKLALPVAIHHPVDAQNPVIYYYLLKFSEFL